MVLVGDGPFRARAVAAGALCPGRLAPGDVRNFYAGSDVVVVPSVPTRDFLEPWGLVVNEAFDQGVPVIATTAVGAAAGGLVRHEETGLVVPAGDEAALAAALRRLRDDPALRARLGAAGRDAVAAGHSHADWAAGMGRALAAAGAGRRPEVAASVAARHAQAAACHGADAARRRPGGDGGHPRDIIADCYDDGKLDGNYSPSEIRDARNNLPADIDQYSDCRDVLARALGGSGDKSVGGGSGGGGALGGGGGGSDGPAQPLTPSGPEEQAALDEAALAGGDDPSRSATARSCPARSTRARNTIPPSLLAVLILLGVAAFAAAVPSVRRRVLARRLA